MVTSRFAIYLVGFIYPCCVHFFISFITKLFCYETIIGCFIQYFFAARGPVEDSVWGGFRRCGVQHIAGALSVFGSGCMQMEDMPCRNVQPGLGLQWSSGVRAGEREGLEGTSSQEGASLWEKGTGRRCWRSLPSPHGLWKTTYSRNKCVLKKCHTVFYYSG